MAVFTALHLDDIGQWITQFPLGKPLALKGIASGIENSNFFLSTERGEHVLTIFENLSFQQLPFYLQLMRHLAERGVLVPAPIRTVSPTARSPSVPVPSSSRSGPPVPGRSA